MTDDATTSGRIERVLESDRAMIPLALVGALVLLSSVLLVGYMQTGGESEPDTDASLAVDRTEATMQTIVRDGVQRASEKAAAEPVTAPADTEWGAVLDRSGSGFSEDPFVNYLRALIYLEVHDDLQLAGQTDGDVETNVTLPAVTDQDAFADAIQRVALDRNGTDVTVSLSNVTITATDAGEVIEQRETTVEVTVVTPVLELHEKVSEYQYAIDEAGVTERGFTQRFNARTYAIGWARGWAQNYQAPVGEVLANRHVEPSANSALYRTQQDVFGAADPNLQNAVRLGWACMALKDGAAMFDEYAGERTGMTYDTLQYDDGGAFAYNDSHSVGVPDGVGGLCRSTHFLLDQAIEQHPRPPDVTELIGGQDLLQENESITVGETAQYPLVEMMDADSQFSVESAIQRIFTIAGKVDAETRTTGRLTFDLRCGPGYSGGVPSRDGSYDVTSSQEPVTGDDERYYVYESTIDVTVTATRVCREQQGNGTKRKTDTDSYTVQLTTTVGEHEDSPGATIDDVNPSSEISASYKYTPGPDGWGPSPFNNYDGASDEVTAGIFGGTDAASHEQWLRNRMAGTDYEWEPPGAHHFETTEVVELDYDEMLGGFELTVELMDDIADLRTEAANVSVEFERHELVSDNPSSQLLDELETRIKERYIDEPDGFQYENVGEKVRYEARYAYYLALVEQLEGLERAHGQVTNELDDRITAADGSLGNATRFLAQGIRQQESTPAAFRSSALTDDVSYEVSGSPTYLLSTDTVSTERVPPVDQDTEFAPLRTKNENAFDMPYDDVINGVLSTVLDALPTVSATPDAEISLRMAGDVLSAGERAIDAHENAMTTGRGDTYLSEREEFERDFEEFEENVDDALDRFEQRVATRTVEALYPSPAAECLLYPSAADDRHPGQETCTNALQEHGELDGLVIPAKWAVEDGIASALDPYGTAEAARLVGEGNATEYIVDNVTRELDDAEFRAQALNNRFDKEQWDELVEAAVRPAVMSAAATAVELGSAEQAEALDETIQEALGKATTTAVDDRVTHASEAIGETVGERWLGNTYGTKQRAARVPAGLPLVPLPGKWVATVNAWTIEVAGEYARFEASATVGTPADGTQMTYVRENRTVSDDIAGEERTLGSVESIAFDSRTVLVVVTPPGVGVGDRDSQNPECSATYPHVGEVDPDREEDCSGFSAED